jgi:NAD(P)-dependent dehydrogenase (short-subunit alcohol dehydrogenase family)
MAAAGAKVVVNDIGASLAGEGSGAGPAQQVADEIIKAGGQAVPNTDSVATRVSAHNIIETAVQTFGRIDIVVNNAGLNRPKPLVDVQDEDIDAVLDLNLKAVFKVTRGATRRLVSAGLPGSIVNISSQMGVVGSPSRTLYCASKHGIEGMTKALAWELGHANIRVNTICPTFIETSMTAPMFENPAFRSWVLERIALGRLGQDEEIMGDIFDSESED